MGRGYLWLWRLEAGQSVVGIVLKEAIFDALVGVVELLMSPLGNKEVSAHEMAA